MSHVVEVCFTTFSTLIITMLLLSDTARFLISYYPPSRSCWGGEGGKDGGFFPSMHQGPRQGINVDI